MIYGKLIRKGYAIIFSFNIFLIFISSCGALFCCMCGEKANNGCFVKDPCLPASLEVNEEMS